MKLYTKTGDDGSTGLFGAGRVGKDDLRVSAYGTVDELNASLGVVLAQFADADPAVGLRPVLQAIQSRLFDLGADLATPLDSGHDSKVQRIEQAHVTWLENHIDTIDGDNAPMQNFVMPGGTYIAALLHLARTIARRAERLVVALGRHEPINPFTVIYLNRVSDLLFAMARAANRLAGLPDVPWQPGEPDRGS